MPTRELIESSSDHLDDVAKLVIVSLIRELENYRKYAVIFSSKLTPAINSAEGTLKARQLNSILSKIEKLGVGEVDIVDNKEGVRWSQGKEREALILKLFTTLFDDAFESGSSAGKTVDVARGNFGIAATGQRPCYHASPCGCR